MFNLYAGLGYRLKQDKSSDEYSYPRKSQYFYIPIGVKIPTELNLVTVTPYIEYDVLVKGRQTSDLRKLNISKMNHKQKHGFGIKSGAGFKYDQFEITPYVHYWNIKKSEATIVSSEDKAVMFFEPKNTTSEIGIKVTFVF